MVPAQWETKQSINMWCTKQGKGSEALTILSQSNNWWAGTQALELGSRTGDDERESDFALPVSLAVCWYNNTLERSDRGIPAESDYSQSYKPFSLRLHSGPITNNCTWPSRVMSFSHIQTLSDLNKSLRVSEKKLNKSTAAVTLTNLTVSVVFLYGVVFGEANPSHPFDAFRCC